MLCWLKYETDFMLYGMLYWKWIIPLIVWRHSSIVHMQIKAVNTVEMKEIG